MKPNRRDLLKGMAAVPAAWLTRKVDVARLTAHAQASGPTLSNPFALNGYEVDLTDPPQTGSIFFAAVDYHDPAGGVTTGASLTVEVPGYETSFPPQIPIDQVGQIGDRFSGVLLFALCVHFGTRPDFTLVLTLTNAAGATGNTLSLTTPRHPGALETGGPARLRLLPAAETPAPPPGF